MRDNFFERTSLTESAVTVSEVVSYKINQVSTGRKKMINVGGRDLTND